MNTNSYIYTRSKRGLNTLESRISVKGGSGGAKNKHGKITRTLSQREKVDAQFNRIIGLNEAYARKLERLAYREQKKALRGL